MGCCQGNSTKQTVSMKTSCRLLCTYYREATIKIKGNNNKTENLHLTFTEPMLFSSQKVQIDSYDLWISKCALPGIDPCGEKKTCQDYCVFINDETSVLLAVFDGHGIQGEKVAQFCSSCVESFFPDNKELSTSDPKEFLIALTEKCAEDLKQHESDIDSKYSGCTAVFVFLSGDAIYSASVGDSRAVLGTSSPPTVMPAPAAQIKEEDRKMLEEVKSRRQSQPALEILPVQLTKDQKPEDPEELARIIQKGGKVQRITDKSGKKIGPYRVWEPDLKSLGLAMSRSIGDSTGNSVGIISTPICTKHKVNPFADCFVVAGTDGIWDAMDNQDVVNYVEFYRDKCKRGCTSPPVESKVSPDNTCIAQLLCEEARVRWMSILEEEDVIVDDISCIILELQPATISLSAHEKRPIPNDHSPHREIEDLSNQEIAESASVRDPRRGSIILSAS
ncbi:unnamed protein product [Blepharisma stoltei]|uniref:PPM-type phosphatase domain-containing protein n=1 Tax=Blepharisma stoltei TaxID=1481888 RepID=A0AAU9K4C4_9CILI|nr:unnamed protein product [Blepharisma stoltei]